MMVSAFGANKGKQIPVASTCQEWAFEKAQSPCGEAIDKEPT